MRDAAALAEPQAAASIPEAASPLLERQLQLLSELAEIGLDIARALAGQAGGAGPNTTDGDIALAYSRVARAVRQAILLQSRLVDDSRARTAAADKAGADARGAAAQIRQERSDARKCRLSWIVERVVEAGHDDKIEVDRLVREADERLDDDTLLGDVLARPTSEVVADICQALGLDPDRTRLAQEAWAKEELASGDVGWPFAVMAHSALPLDGREAGNWGDGSAAARWKGHPHARPFSHQDGRESPGHPP